MNRTLNIKLEGSEVNEINLTRIKYSRQKNGMKIKGHMKIIFKE